MRVILSTAACAVLVLGGCGTSPAPADWEAMRAAVPPAGERGVLDALEARARDVLGALRHPEDRAAWEQAVPRLRGQLAAAVGIDRLPKAQARHARSVGTIDRGSYRIEKLVYETFPGTEVPAHLYLPCGSDGKRPAVLVVPGHSWSEGKGAADRQALCIHLAKLGFVALTYDPVGEGERGVSFRDHRRTELLLGGVSQQAVCLFESQCAIDYLFSRPEVDAARLGMTGESGGGFNTWITAALDERVAVAVPVVGTSDFLEQVRTLRPLDWYMANEHCHFPPGLFRFANNKEFLAMAAPRPLLIVSAHNDEAFPLPGIRKVADYGKNLYAALAEPAKFSYFEDASSGHGYQKKKREAAYGWFLKWLKGEGDGSPAVEPETETTSWESPDLCCFPPGEKHPAGPGIIAQAKALIEGHPLPDKGRMRDALIEALGVSPSDEAVLLERGSSRVESGFLVERIGWRMPDRVFVPALRVSLPGHCRGVLLAAADTGKESLLGHPAVRAAAESGYAVVVADPRGIGELSTTKAGWIFVVSLLVGENFVGRQALDLAGGYRALQEIPELRGKPVGLLGSGPFASMAALYAAVLEPRFASLVHEGGFVTYRSFIDREKSLQESYTLAPPGVAGAVRVAIGARDRASGLKDSYLTGRAKTIDREIPHALFVFDVLRRFDLPDLFESLAPRRVLTVNPIDGEFKAAVDPNAAAKMRVFVTGRTPPPDAPAFPFDAESARRYQKAYAAWAGLPVEFAHSSGMTFVLVPPGTFRWASSVTLTRPFYLGKHEVTVGAFRRFAEATDYITDVEKNGGGHAHDDKANWSHHTGTSWRKPGYAGLFELRDDHPVVHVSWTDAGAFCRWLGPGFSLPTEAQWEWACRAGSDDRFGWGPGEDTTGRVANVGDRTLKKVHPEWPRAIMPMEDGHAFAAPAGSYCPNAFGLCDMLGNVWEFCLTRHGPYPEGPIADPGDLSTTPDFEVRGGGWSNASEDVGCGVRNSDPPHFGHSNLGFRVARAIPGF